jgi:hypothetical protein
MHKQHSGAVIQMFLVLFSSLALAQAGSAPKPESESGLEGVITVSPVQGGPTRQGVPDSKPLANMEFVVKKGENSVASFKTDDQGRFRIALPPGQYAISRKEGVAIGNYGPFPVEVTAGQMKTVHWDCDTGLR